MNRNLTVISWLLGAIGLYFIAAGAILFLAGGTPFYTVLGCAFLAIAILLWRRNHHAFVVAAIALAGTIGWSLYEVGFNLWGLEVRLLVPTLAIVCLILPPIRKSLEPKNHWSKGATLLGVCLVISVVTMALGTISLLPYHESQAPHIAEISEHQSAAGADWREFAGAGSDRYSQLRQITPSNVGRLRRAWIYHTGLATPRGDLEATPLKIADTLYICSNRGVAAVDAETGKQKWLYIPPAASKKKQDDTQGAGTCRGLSYYDGTRDGLLKPVGQSSCRQRIFEPTRWRVIALDALTGRPCAEFGIGGILDTSAGLGGGARRWISVTSPPLVIRDKLIVGQSVSDSQFFGEPAGGVRAYDVRTGKLLWAWDVGRSPTNKPLGPGELYTPDTPNAWAPITGDASLGLAYVPTGVTTPDYFGGQRRAYPFDDKYSTAIVALNVQTGLERWHFQTVHHDLWDMDVPVGPSLVDLTLRGSKTPVPALVQSTKLGELFVLDRRTGAPLFHVAEKPVPVGDIEGEYYSPSQPFVDGAQSLRPPNIREADAWGATLFDQLVCRIEFKRLDYRGPFTPTSMRGSLIFPAYFGVTDWSGVGIDPTRQIAVQNMSYMPWKARLYRRSDAEARGWVKPWNGHGPIPSRGLPSVRPQYFSPYVVKIEPWINFLGVPCKAPPFGELAGYDLRDGKVLWKEVFGTSRHNGPLGLQQNLALPTGIYSIGGALTTATGLTFIAGTADRQFRAFDTASGGELWHTALPYAGNASPMTYLGKDGQQYVAIAAGGNWGLRDGVGDAVVAFTLKP